MAQEEPSEGEVTGLTRDGVLERDALHLGLTEDADNLGVPGKLDLGVAHGTLLHDLAGAERVAPVDDRHLVRETGEEGRLFHGGVTATDHRDVLAAEEEAVTGRAGRDTVPQQPVLVGQTDLAPL